MTFRADDAHRRHMHRRTYNALASEYEQRADVHRANVVAGVARLTQYLKPQVLDLGCGVGVSSQALFQQRCCVTGIDVSEKMLAHARRRSPHAHFIHDDFMRHTFDVQFDAVYESAFLHVFPKNQVASVLEKIRRILKPGGYLFTTTTESPQASEGEEVKQDYRTRHVRYRAHWERQEFIDLLAHNGFTIRDTHTHTDPFGKTWMEYVAQVTLPEPVHQDA